MKTSLIILIFSFWLMATQAWSEEDWYLKGSGQLLFKSYAGSTKLENLSGFGVFLSGDYLEQSGLTVGYNSSQTNYKSVLSSGLQETDETILYLSGRSNFHLDQLPGRLTLRLDAYVGNDKLRFRSTAPGLSMGGGVSQQVVTETVKDKFVVVYPTISFLNYAKSFYADLGYAHSSYHSDDNDSDDLDIDQWSPTLGWGFNRSYDWLQLRAYLISLSASNRVAGKDSTSALEAKWIHWFSAGAPLSLHSTRLTVVVGERLYAVDSDTYSLFNIADLQTGAISIGAEWKLSEQASMFFQGGYEAYEDLLLNDRYSSTYIYVYMSQNW